MKRFTFVALIMATLLTVTSAIWQARVEAAVVSGCFLVKNYGACAGGSCALADYRCLSHKVKIKGLTLRWCGCRAPVDTFTTITAIL